MSATLDLWGITRVGLAEFDGERLMAVLAGMPALGQFTLKQTVRRPKSRNPICSHRPFPAVRMFMMSVSRSKPVSPAWSMKAPIDPNRAQCPDATPVLRLEDHQQQAPAASY